MNITLTNVTSHSNTNVVIFQKNVAAMPNDVNVAWKVFPNIAAGANVPFVFDAALQVGASDSWGNTTPPIPAQIGQLHKVSMSASGDQLVPSGPASSPNEVQVLNDLPRGAINASIYRSGMLLATKTGLAPQQKAAFQFTPTIWIGVADHIVPGEVMSQATVAAINTQINLMGIARASIIMKEHNGIFSFVLDNVVYA